MAQEEAEASEEKEAVVEDPVEEEVEVKILKDQRVVIEVEEEEEPIEAEVRLGNLKLNYCLKHQLKNENEFSSQNSIE